MIDINQQMDYFNKLNYEEKKQHLLKMLEKIKDKHEIFFKSYETISMATKVEEVDLISVYKLIFEVSNWLENNKKASDEQISNNIKIYIDKLREKERIIREKEQEEAEQLLESI